MNYAKKLEYLGQTLKLPGFDALNAQQKSNAIKKATGKVTLEEAFDYVKAGGKAVANGAAPSQSATDKKVEVRSGEIIPPSASAANVAHTVDVGAPSIHVNVPAPVVTVNHGELSWSHALRQGLLWINGAVVGGMTVALVFLWGAQH